MRGTRGRMWDACGWLQILYTSNGSNVKQSKTDKNSIGRDRQDGNHGTETNQTNQFWRSMSLRNCELSNMSNSHAQMGQTTCFGQWDNMDEFGKWTFDKLDWIVCNQGLSLPSMEPQGITAKQMWWVALGHDNFRVCHQADPTTAASSQNVRSIS